MDWQQASCFLNGEWKPLAEANVSVLDRGFIFGDGIYELVPVDEVEPGMRAPFRARAHFERMSRGLAAIGIDNPRSVDGWLELLAQVIDVNRWPRQSVYVQVTRGVARRDHMFPAGVTPTVLMTSWPWAAVATEQLEDGVAAITHADERWLHCDIKSISLLGNVLMRQLASERGAAEAILLRDGFLTEGSSTNVFIVSGGRIVTPPKSNLILPGITYDAVLEIARARGAACEVRAIPERELRNADEIWLTSSGREVLPVTSADGKAVGTGRVGTQFRQMHAWFQQAKRDDARVWRGLLPALKRAA